jgi:uncharacterized protein (DUF1499 family)
MSESGSGVGRVALILGCVAAAAFIGGPLLASIGVLPPLTAFSVFGLGGLLGLITLVVSLFVAWRRGSGAAAGGLVLGGVISLAFIGLALPSRNLPRINDITTDTQQPPQFVQAPNLPGNAGRDMGYPGESFAAQQREGYPNLKPQPLAEAPPAAFERVSRAAGEMPAWEITRTDAGAFAIEGVATSRLFRFQDDFVIEVRPADGGSVVQMRSKSRDGRGDVGANAARIEAFFAKLR